MFTIVASSTTMSWARPTVPRISHRRESEDAEYVVAIHVMLPTGRPAVVGHRR